MFSVVRDVHKENFTVISNTILQDSRVSLELAGFLIKVLSLPDDWDFSPKGMAIFCSVTENKIYGYIRQLEHLGYLRREKVKEKGKYIDTVYRFYEEHIEEKPLAEKPHMDEPHMEEPHMDEPHMDEPCVENSSQLNTNIQNTNKPNTKETNTNGPITQRPNSPQAETDGVQFITSGERRELFRKNIGADILASLYGERFAEDALRAMELLASGVGRYVNGERVEGEELKKYMLLVRQEDVRMAEELVSGKELKNYIAYFGSVLFNTVRERVYREERERQRSERAAVPLFRQQTQDADTVPDDGTYQNADVQAFMEKVMRRYLE